MKNLDDVILVCIRRIFLSYLKEPNRKNLYNQILIKSLQEKGWRISIYAYILNYAFSINK